MKKNLIILDDKELVALFKSGNQEAFGALVEKHSKALSINIFFILKDPMLVEDVMQDTFIKAMNAITKGKYSEENFLGWISRIGHNSAIDYFRKKKRRPTVSINQSDVDGGGYSLDDWRELGPEEDIVKQEVDYDINELVNMLPPEQKEVVSLRYFNDLSFKEIAEYIGGGVSINTCLGRARYGLINLKKIIRQIKTEGRGILK